MLNLSPGETHNGRTKRANTEREASILSGKENMYLHFYISNNTINKMDYIDRIANPSLCYKKNWTSFSTSNAQLNVHHKSSNCVSK